MRGARGPQGLGPASVRLGSSPVPPSPPPHEAPHAAPSPLLTVFSPPRMPLSFQQTPTLPSWPSRNALFSVNTSLILRGWMSPPGACVRSGTPLSMLPHTPRLGARNRLSRGRAPRPPQAAAKSWAQGVREPGWGQEARGRCGPGTGGLVRGRARRQPCMPPAHCPSHRCTRGHGRGAEGPP